MKHLHEECFLKSYPAVGCSTGIIADLAQAKYNPCLTRLILSCPLTVITRMSVKEVRWTRRPRVRMSQSV